MDCRWELVEKVSDEELEARAVPQVVHDVIDFVETREAAEWSGTASDLLAAVGGEVRPNVLSKYLNEHSDFMRREGIRFWREKTSSSKLIHLERMTVVVDGVDDSGYRFLSTMTDHIDHRDMNGAPVRTPPQPFLCCESSK